MIGQKFLSGSDAFSLATLRKLINFFLPQLSFSTISSIFYLLLIQNRKKLTVLSLPLKFLEYRYLEEKTHKVSFPELFRY